jgi:hypothetical protein
VNRIQVVSWDLKPPPIAVTRSSVVVDPAKFAETTIRQLEAALAGKPWLSGQRSVSDLCERLKQVGVTVAITEPSEARL